MDLCCVLERDRKSLFTEKSNVWLDRQNVILVKAEGGWGKAVNCRCRIVILDMQINGSCVLA